MSDYFKQQLELLKIEREEDLQSFLKLSETSSISDRRSNGFTWYPIAIRDSEMTRGDYLVVEVERTTHQDVSHQLRFGASAVLFSNHDAKKDRIEGTISHQSGNRLKITLRTDELPDWSRDGKLGVDLLFDNNSYDEMQYALKQGAALIEKDKEGRLARVLIGRDEPVFRPDAIGYNNLALNEKQNEAVNKILSANQLAIVHGPPGTGKTTTLVQAIKAIIKQEKQQVLVVAPSNTAVDLLSEKLAEEGLNVLRVGNPARVSERLIKLTLDSKMAEHSGMKEIRKQKKQAAEYKNMAHKYKRSFGRAEQEQRKALFSEARKIMNDVADTEQYIMDDLFAKAQVITATLVGSNHYTVRSLKFKTVVIDEAGQALEPSCWIPILKAEKLILAGDHCQLPPTIKSQEASRKGLGTTLLEKTVKLHPEAVILLEEQYRMNQVIMGFPSIEFYQSKLTAHHSVANHVLFQNEEPLLFIDTAGCGFDEKAEGTSSSNPDEAAFLLKHLSTIAAELAIKLPLAEFPSIGIISPYKQQIQILNELLPTYPHLQQFLSKITVNTVDSFQGQERDVIYISLTRSNAAGIIGFLADIRRMNVAITRARKKLVVIGDSATLSRLKFYANFIAYAEKHNAYKSAWEFMDV